MDYEFLLKIGLAVLIGGALGAEREYKNKSAGLRTMILICVASTLFTMLSIQIGGRANPDRIASNILTGLGFLGAGVIFKEENRISGLTTAITIWVAAALGMAIGSGHYIWAIGSTLLILLVLLSFLYLQKIIDKAHQIRIYRILVPYDITQLAAFESLFRTHKLKARRLAQSRTGNLLRSSWTVTGTRHHHERMTTLLLEDKLVHEFDF